MKDYLNYLSIEELKERKKRLICEVKELYHTLDLIPEATFLAVLSIKSLIKRKEKHISEITEHLKSLKNVSEGGVSA